MAENKKMQPDEFIRQDQSEGTPRPFSNEAGRNESRNIVPAREHLSEVKPSGGYDDEDMELVDEDSEAVSNSDENDLDLNDTDSSSEE